VSKAPRKYPPQVSDRDERGLWLLQDFLSGSTLETVARSAGISAADVEKAIGDTILRNGYIVLLSLFRRARSAEKLRPFIGRVHEDSLPWQPQKRPRKGL